MKKYIMMLLMLIIASATFSQVVPKYDRVIDEGIYKSYYSYTDGIRDIEDCWDINTIEDKYYRDSVPDNLRTIHTTIIDK